MKKSEVRQNEILEYMKHMIKEKGFPPTVREICTDLNIKSTSTVHMDIKALEQRGLLKKDPSKPRALMIVDNAVAVSEDLTSKTSSYEGFDVVSIPVIGRVAAGTPILSEENIEDEMPFPARFIGSGNNFMLTVHGSSMINAGIHDGDYLLVQEKHEAYNGEIVVAMIEGEYENEATVKRFYKENGHIRLQPENDAMEPIIVDNCTIIGKVCGVFRYMN